ncbi:MAG: PEP-CTERM sorting domain-containing protein [Symploca sp. SIO2E9]|nr:PEP-CTERM sorting domain-containing protein [Symploca sp. SIO2E9]
MLIPGFYQYPYLFGGINLMSISSTLKKLSIAAVGASVVAFGVSNDPAEAARFFEVTSVNPYVPISGSFEVDDTANSLISNNFASIYQNAVPEAEASSPFFGSLQATDLDLVVLNRFFLGKDSIRFSGDVNYITFSFANAFQFASTELSDVLDSLDGSTAFATSNLVSFGLPVKFTEVKVAESVPEPASMLGLVAIGALGAGSAWKRKQKQQ